MNKIKIAIIGVWDCASSLVNGGKNLLRCSRESGIKVKC